MRAEHEGALGAQEDKAVPAVFCRQLWFSYGADLAKPVLRDVNLALEPGSFVVISGPQGSGKSTLLRMFKPELVPAGTSSGVVKLFGRDAQTLDVATSAELLGFLQQEVAAQFVADDVWHELAFGPSCLGLPPDLMGRRVAELAVSCGIDQLVRRSVHELSGGQQQLVAIAAALAVNPKILVLDEPTAELDPIAETRIAELLARINRQYKTTIILATHRASAFAPFASHAFKLHEGVLEPCAVEELVQPPAAHSFAAPPSYDTRKKPSLALRDCWYTYNFDAPWVLTGASLSVKPGQIMALVGGNGSGKSTLLKLAAGVAKPQHGRVQCAARTSQVYLPQDATLLLKDEPLAEFLAQSCKAADAASNHTEQSPEVQALVDATLAELGLSHRRAASPFELSRGQQLLVALASVLLRRPQIALLDEPTRGLDASGQAAASRLIADAAAHGTCVLVATHDLAYAQNSAHTVAFVFGGGIVATQDARQFFDDNLFWRP